MNDYDFVLCETMVAGQKFLQIRRKNKSKCYCINQIDDYCTSLCVAFQPRECEKGCAVYLACMQRTLYFSGVDSDGS